MGVLDGVGEAQGGVWYYFTFNFLKFQEVTNQILDIFKLAWRFQVSQISKCPNITVILTYWEPSREVSKRRYISVSDDHTVAALAALGLPY